MPGEEGGADVRGRGLAEEVPLHAVAAAGGEEGALSLRLHALGHDLQLERVAEGDDRRRHRLALAAAEVADERAVDLERLHGQTAQERERRRAHAEVIDEDAGPQRPDALESRARGLASDHRVPLRDLDVEVADTLTEHAQVAIFQIIRDALHHAIRRGPPTRISVRVAEASGSIEALISDDAPGERRRASYDEIVSFYDEVKFFPPVRYSAGIIGGHCVMPNIEILGRLGCSDILGAIESSNRMKITRERRRDLPGRSNGSHVAGVLASVPQP